MLDNLREQATFQEEELPELNPPKPLKLPKRRRPRRSFDQITGTTAGQRFTLALMLSVMLCLLGMIFLFITGKMVPSFLF